MADETKEIVENKVRKIKNMILRVEIVIGVIAMIFGIGLTVLVWGEGFFPGALIGLYVADRIRKYSYIHAVSRYLIANVSAIVFAFCISSLTAFLNMMFQQFIGSPTAANFPALFGSMLLLNAFMGLPGLILAEILVGFSAAD